MSSSAASAPAATAGSAIVELQEMPRLLDRFGGGAATQIATQVTELIATPPRALERAGVDRDGRLLLLLPGVRPQDVEQPARRPGPPDRRHPLRPRQRGRRPGDPGDRLGPSFATASSGEQLRDRALTAVRVAGDHLDLLPVEWTPALEPVTDLRRRGPGRVRRTAAVVGNRLRLPAQFLLTLVLGVGLPFLGYVALGASAGTCPGSPTGW